MFNHCSLLSLGTIDLEIARELHQYDAMQQVGGVL